MADKFMLIINTPDRQFYQNEVSMVELATSEGEIGVYAEHIPMTSVLVPCVLMIHEESGTKKAAVHSSSFLDFCHALPPVPLKYKAPV